MSGTSILADLEYLFFKILWGACPRPPRLPKEFFKDPISLWSMLINWQLCRLYPEEKESFTLQMAQFDWSILVDAVDLEVVLVVLEIPHHNCLLK